MCSAVLNVLSDDIVASHLIRRCERCGLAHKGWCGEPVSNHFHHNQPSHAIIIVCALARGGSFDAVVWAQVQPPRPT